MKGVILEITALVIQDMARDLHRRYVQPSEVTDGLGRPTLAATLELGNEYREEQAGELPATHGAVAFAVAYNSHDPERR